MNKTDQNLDRLFRAAAQAPRGRAAEVPFAIESRVLAQLRGGMARRSDDIIVGLLPLFRGAFLMACVLALAVIALNFSEMDESPVDELAIVNSTIDLAGFQ